MTVQRHRRDANIVYLLLVVSGTMLGWGFYQQYKNDFNLTQAITRANPTGNATILLWEYTGKPLKPGQLLRIKTRYLYSGPSGRIRVVIYEDRDGDGVPDTELYKGRMAEGNDHLHWFEEQVKVKEEWSSRIFIGLESPPEIKTFWAEKEYWRFSPLSSTFFYSTSESNKFEKGSFPLTSELCVYVESPVDASKKHYKIFYIAGVALSVFAFIFSIYRRVTIAPYLALVIFVLIWRWLSGLAPTSERWSGFFFPRMPNYWLWGMHLLTLLLCMPAVSCKLYDWFRGLASWCQRKSGTLSSALFYLVIICGGGYVFWSWRSNAVYGDGYGPLSMGYEYHNPLAIVLYDLYMKAVRLFFPQFPNDWTKSIPMYSTLWGMIFLFVLIKLSKNWGRNAVEKWLIFLALLSLPAIAQFFGYAEVYASVISLSLLVLLLFRKYLAGKISIVTFSSGAFFNYLHHLSTAVFFPLVAAGWFRYLAQLRGGIFKRGWHGVKAILITLFIALFIWAQCLFFLLLLRYDFDLSRYHFKINQYGLEFLYGGKSHRLKSSLLLNTQSIVYPHIYRLGSYSHLSQTFAEWMFLAPLVIPLFLALCVLYLGKILRNFTWLSLALTGWFLIITALLVSPLYPYPKDWDLFALHSVGLQFIVVILASNLIRSQWRRYLLITLIVSQCFWTLAFIYYNHFCGVPLGQRFFGFY